MEEVKVELTPEECDALIAQARKAILIAEKNPRPKHICCQVMGAMCAPFAEAANKIVPVDRQEEMGALVFQAATGLARPHMSNEALLFLHNLWGGRDGIRAKLAEYREQHPEHQMWTIDCGSTYGCEFVLDYHVADKDSLPEDFANRPFS